MTKITTFIDKCTGKKARETRRQMDALSKSLQREIVSTYSHTKGASQEISSSNLPARGAGRNKKESAYSQGF